MKIFNFVLKSKLNLHFYVKFDGESDGDGHKSYKPYLDPPASRVGVKKSGSTPGHRPVKCTLTSSTAVHQILLKSRQLKLLDTYKSVFICPDRTPEERAARRALVAELKAANTKQPNHRHYIKHGKVHSSET